MNAHLFLDIQAIQTVPPCNINRDDAGSPKTAQYGGVTRTRISSQCWKHSMREYFKEHSGDSNVGIRSKNIVKYVADKIITLKPELSEQEALDLADKTLNTAGVKTKTDKGETVPTAK
ncbi:type I-E CRISPR-associated protein Cas7/Cse4/CasC, partial [Gardnerella vaginalis]